eukprot:m.8267 g.8267  ORF g.8267 m.8267 type:complete len:411 (+) comp3861_c0_seq1:175-1407(+)
MSAFSQDAIIGQLYELEYNDPVKVMRDVQNCCSSYTELRQEIANFAFNDGTSRRLLSLKGTLPVQMLRDHKVYHFPIQIWIMQHHPNMSPICYVVPEPNMKINAKHKQLNSNGMVSFNWNRGSSLFDMAQMLQRFFSEESPVFTVTNPTPAPHPSIHTTQYTSQRYQPGNGGNSYESSHQPSNYNSVGSTNNYHAPQYPTRQTQPSTFNDPGLAYNTDHTSRRASDTSQQVQYQEKPSKEPSEDMQEALKMSMITAIDQKCRGNFEAMREATGSRMQSFVQKKGQLEGGGRELMGIMRQIDQEMDRAGTASMWYENEIPKLHSLCRTLEEQVSQGSMSDDAVDCSSPLHKQILRLMSEDSALEDVLYSLGRYASKDGDVGEAVKLMREHASAQFYARDMLLRAQRQALNQ